MKWAVGNRFHGDRGPTGSPDAVGCVCFFDKRDVLSVLGEYLAEHRVAGLDVIGRAREVTAHLCETHHWRHLGSHHLGFNRRKSQECGGGSVIAETQLRRLCRPQQRRVAERGIVKEMRDPVLKETTELTLCAEDLTTHQKPLGRSFPCHQRTWIVHTKRSEATFRARTGFYRLER